MKYCVSSGLERRAAELAGALPYGEQRLLGIALALAAQPSMLLLDEPVSGMNPSETAKVMKLVETIRASGVTILLVEHDMPMVMQVSDRDRRAQLRAHHRGRPAGGHPEQSRRHSRLSGRGKEACLSCAMSSAATAR